MLEPPEVLIPRIARILAKVDFGASMPSTEYLDYSEEVLRRSTPTASSFASRTWSFARTNSAWTSTGAP